MKAMLFSLCLLFSVGSFAKTCYTLETEVTVLRTLTAPSEVCLSHVRTKYGKLEGKLYIDGVESELSAAITNIVDMGVHFEKGTVRNLYTETTYDRGCDELDAINLSLDVVMDYDGSLTGLDTLSGVAGYTMDICHTRATSQKLVYKRVAN